MSEPRGLILDADQAAAELCKRKLSFFVREFWDVIVPNELQWNWHIDVLCDEIQASDELVFKRLPKLHDLIINVPPGTSKTKIVSILSTAWELARMPSIKVFVGSFSDAAVSSMADEIKLLMRSQKYLTYFPETRIRRDRDALHNFKTTVNGEFYAFTVGGTLMSKHADILKIDDPIDPKGAKSEKEMKTANDFFDETLPTRKVDKKVTPFYLIMQRLGDTDPTAHLLDKKGDSIRHIRLPGTLEYQVSPKEYEKFYVDGFLDTNRLSAESLAELKIDLGSYGFAGQIGQDPAPSTGLIWQKWFIEVPDYDFPDYTWGGVSDLGTDWDLAYTKDDENAASAYMTSFKYRNKIYIDALGWDWLEFPELIKWMKTKPGTHFIEDKGPGKSAKQTLSNHGIIAIEFKLKGGKDKVARARMATPVAESGIVFIRKSLADKLYNDPRQGILRFPKGKFMDMADATSQCLQRHKSGGVKVMGEKEFDALDELDY